MNTLDDVEEVAVVDENAIQPLPTLADYLPQFYEQMGTQGEGAKTYFSDFDKALCGMRGLVIIGGEPGSGKTALVLQIGYESAADGIPVLIYSFEMPKNQVVTRLFQRAGKVQYQKLQRPWDEVKELASLKEAKEKIDQVASKITILETRDFFVTDNAGVLGTQFDFAEQIAKINHLKETHGKAPVVIIDSLHEIPAPGHFRELKQKIDYLMLNLRNAADQTGATFLLISHQSRSGQKEGGLNSYLGSASIEYTVDMAFTVAKPEKPLSDLDRELLTQKNRYGPKPKASLTFDGKYMDFTLDDMLQ